MKKILYALILYGLVIGHLAASGKPGYIKRVTSLYAEPFKDAEVIVSLPVNTGLSIIKRKGGWYQVNANDQTGWVRLVTVRLGKVRTSESGSSGGDAIELLGGLATGREKSSEVTTASAVKGLGEEDLRDATPDTDAIDELDEFAADEQAGLEAAEQAGLKPVDIPLPVAKDAARETTPPAAKPDDGEEE